MSEITVREYRPEDREAVEECIFELQEEEKARQPHVWKDPEEVKKIYIDYATKSTAEAEGKIFVAETGGKVVGFTVIIMNHDDSPAYLQNKYGYVMDLVVLRKFQGQGIGRALMEKAEEFAREAGAEWMQLHATAGNPALDFYAKSGYRQKDIGMEKKIS